MGTALYEAAHYGLQHLLTPQHFLHTAKLMLEEHRPARFRDNDRVVKDVLAGQECILPLIVGGRHYPCRTVSACQFAALNFVRVAFKHTQRERGNVSPSLALLLNAITERHVLEEILLPGERLTGEQPIQLTEMSRVPLFEGALRHVATNHGPPSMILLKQSLRQMQLHPSPVSAMVVSRDASTTVCLRLREDRKHVFLVLDFGSTPPGHRHYHGPSNRGATLALVISTSLQQTAARLSGISPVDNRMVTRDRRWQAQLFSSCTISMFGLVEGFVTSPEAESSSIDESITLLSIMAETDDPGLVWRGERDRDANGEGSGLTRRPRVRPCRSANTELSEGLFDTGTSAPTASRVHARHAGGESLGEGSSTRITEPRSRTTFGPNYRRLSVSEDEWPARMSQSPSLISLPSGTPGLNQESYFECLICFDRTHEEEGIQLIPCAHGFCRSCLAGHVCSKIEERKFPVLCPLCMTDQRNANPSVVSGDLVQRVGVSEEQYTIWSELEMVHLCVRVHCRRCNRSALVDKEDHENLEKLRCPFPGCGHTWCKNCQQTISGDVPNHSCDGTEELDHLVRQMGWKHCPQCRTPVQKNGGCNHMTCVTPGCNTHFCYKCGKQITRSTNSRLANSAVNAHFTQCRL